MKPKIGLITLGVSCIDRSLKFYRDGLGFETHNYKDGDDMVFFKLEGTWLGLYPKDKLAEDAKTENNGKGFPGITLAHLEKSKPEVDATINLAVSAGARLVKKPQEAEWGGYSGYLADPDGYLWEIAYNPFIDLT